MSGTGRCQCLEPLHYSKSDSQTNIHLWPLQKQIHHYFYRVRELTPGPRSVWPHIHLWDRADSEGSEGELGQDDPLRCYLLLLFSRVRQSTKIFWNNISKILFRFVMSVNSDQLPWNTHNHQAEFYCLFEIDLMQLWSFSYFTSI